MASNTMVYSFSWFRGSPRGFYSTQPPHHPHGLVLLEAQQRCLTSPFLTFLSTCYFLFQGLPMQSWDLREASKALRAQNLRGHSL